MRKLILLFIAAVRSFASFVQAPSFTTMPTNLTVDYITFYMQVGIHPQHFYRSTKTKNELDK